MAHEISSRCSAGAAGSACRLSSWAPSSVGTRGRSSTRGLRPSSDGAILGRCVLKSTELLLLRPMMPLVTDTLDRLFTLHRGDLAQDKDRVLAELGPRIRGMAVSHVQVDGALLDRLPNLEIVANFGVGYDTIDAAECGRRGVTVTNTPDVLTDEVADLALGLLLATLRQIPQSDRYLRQGRWLDKPFPLTGTLRGAQGRHPRPRPDRPGGGPPPRRLRAPVAYHGRRRQDDVPYEYHPTLLGLARAVDVLIVVRAGRAGDEEHRRPRGAGGPRPRGRAGQRRPRHPGRRGRARGGAGRRHDPERRARRVRRRAAGAPGPDRPGAHRAAAPMSGRPSTHTRNAMGQLVIDNLCRGSPARGR